MNKSQIEDVKIKKVSVEVQVLRIGGHKMTKATFRQIQCKTLANNHVPSGIARNFWRPVNESLVGKVCPCQDSEPTMVEDKGSFVWRG